jgi:hypothetical protein
MTWLEDMIEARLYYLERTDTVVSVERSPTALGRWCVQALVQFYDGEWGWRDLFYCDSLRVVVDFLRPQHPVILLEELW